MSYTFEKSVKGATKIKLAPPKQKYIDHILQATRAGEAGVAEVFRVLTLRLRDSTWTIAFKALLVVHIMIRDGEANVTLRYLSTDPRTKISLSQYSEVQTQGKSIRAYSQYLIERARGFQKTKIDYVLSGRGRMKALTVDKGLLRETEIVQEQIQALIKCELVIEDLENDISVTAFRFCVNDLMVLFQVMNEGTINVLQNYLTMSRTDAERALEVYKTFAKLTESVMKYLAIARNFSGPMRIEVPALKHAPTSLATNLEAYLNDPDFDTNRRQYVAEHQAKKGIKPSSPSTAAPTKPPTSGATAATATATATITTSKPASAAPASSQPSKGPAPDLIDFFDSIEDHQQPMAQNQSQFQQQQYVSPFPDFMQQPQPTGQMPMYGSEQPGMMPQQTGTNPFMQFQQQPQLQPQYTGAGFGGYTPQPEAQQQLSQQQFPMAPTGPPPNNAGFDQFGQQPFTGQQQQPIPRQQTNPFRLSMMANATGQPAQPTGFQGGSNPFAKTETIMEEGPPAQFNSQFQPQPNYQQIAPQPSQSPPPLQTQQTGTNPFARQPAPSQSPPPQGQGLTGVASTPTGATNPFRQSAFVNQQTGQGWQTGPQASMGGLEQLNTIPVFPRPGGTGSPGPFQQQQQQPQQQQNQSPWQ